MKNAFVSNASVRGKDEILRITPNICVVHYHETALYGVLVVCICVRTCKSSLTKTIHLSAFLELFSILTMAKIETSSAMEKIEASSPISKIAASFGIRDDLWKCLIGKQKFFNWTCMHLERLDARREFEEMQALLTEEDDNGFLDFAEVMACHVRMSNIPGFWNCLDPECGIKLLIDIMPIAGTRKVKIKDLVVRADLNGKTGLVSGLKMINSFPQFAISLEGLHDTEIVFIQPSNLAVVI